MGMASHYQVLTGATRMETGTDELAHNGQGHICHHSTGGRGGVVGGEDATLVRMFITALHINLSHNHEFSSKVTVVVLS